MQVDWVNSSKTRHWLSKPLGKQTFSSRKQQQWKKSNHARVIFAGLATSLQNTQNYRSRGLQCRGFFLARADMGQAASAIAWLLSLKALYLFASLKWERPRCSALSC